MNDVVSRPMPPALPVKAEEWIRQIKDKRTINDLVEDIHMALVSDPKYVDLLTAVYDEQAVEGSLGADNIMAAMAIRTQAKKTPGHESLGNEKLATISKALGVVLRRYNAGRKERRNMVGGVVQTDGNGSE